MYIFSKFLDNTNSNLQAGTTCNSMCSCEKLLYIYNKKNKNK